NAALCLLHDNGHDAKAVIQLANQLVQDGNDTRSAYEMALNAYLSHDPAMLPTVAKVMKLVDASDDGTVDQYDAALSTYVSTGKDTELAALAPMIAQDSLALAVRDGEITPEEAASGDIGKALGFEPGPALQEAAASIGQVSADQPGQQPEPVAWKQQGQPDSPQIGAEPQAQDFTNNSQLALGNSPAGFVARGAQARWARNTFEPGTAGYPTDAAQAV
ncbi:MAG: hypothetical protein KGP14_16275, partial [Betaproteobacteria bacterium]|nr:hypothetical protein [Betaproteobacteria bacterium]